MSSRYGMVLRLEPTRIADYKQLHAKVWPAVLTTITACHIRNYSIFLRRLDDGQHYLFSYFEYDGDNFAADMQAMAADPVTQEWWRHCVPCQHRLADAADGEWWSHMTEVFHHP